VRKGVLPPKLRTDVAADVTKEEEVRGIYCIVRKDCI
jgi:hypothetical protein